MRAVWVVEERVFSTWAYRASYPSSRRSIALSHARSIRQQPTPPGFPAYKARVVKYVPAKPKQRAADAAKERR